jgi:hypothetical protein
MKNLAPKLGEFIPRFFLMIPRSAFWNFFDFIVLCSLFILGVTFYQQRQEFNKLKQELYNIKFQMQALHGDMFILEDDVEQKWLTLQKKMGKVEKDDRPEIHIHGNGDGSVKLYNVSGEIVVETIEGLKVVRQNTRYKK